MKKIFIMISLIASMLISLYIPVYASDTKELELINSIGVEFVNKVLASPQSNMLLIHDYSKNMYLYNVSSGIKIKLFEATTAISLEQMCFSLDGTKAAFKISDSFSANTSRVSVYDTKSGELINTITVKGESSGASALAFDRNNNLITTYFGSRINVVNIDTGVSMLEIDINRHIRILRQNPSNNHVAADVGGMISIYDSKTGASVRTLELDSYNLKSMTYSPNGKYLVISGDEKTIIFDSENNYNKLHEINSEGRISFNNESDVLVIGDKVYFEDDGFDNHVVLKDNRGNINGDCALMTQNGKYYIIYDYNDTGIRMMDASKITIRLREIRLEPELIQLFVGEELELKLTGLYSDDSVKVLNLRDARLNVSDFTLARINDNLKIQGLTTGEVELRITYAGMEIKKQIEIRKAPETKNITVTFGATKYILNDSPLTEQSMVYNGVAYLPASYLATQLGLTARWDSATNITALTSGGTIPTTSSDSSPIVENAPETKTITATFGATRYILNDELFDEDSIVCNGVAYLPAAYLATKLGLTANWDSVTKTTTRATA